MLNYNISEKNYYKFYVKFLIRNCFVSCQSYFNQNAYYYILVLLNMPQYIHEHRR